MSSNKVGSTIKNYKILDELRPGAGGNVYVVEDMNTREKFVLKAIYHEESEKAQFEKIISGWKNLSSKNVVEFKEFFYEGTKSYIVMEYCTGGDLKSIVKKMKLAKKKFTEVEISKIATDVLKGLQAMHSIKMVHRDLKAAKILKSADGTYKLAEFNVSRVLSDDGAATMSFVSIIQYVAPELLQNKVHSFASDMYAVGAVFYELIALAPAFTDMDIPSVLANRYRPLDASLGYAAGLTQLVHRMLALDPAARPTVDDALSATVFVQANSEAAEGEIRRQAMFFTTLQQTVSDLQRTVMEQQAIMTQQQAAMAQQQETIATLQQNLETLQKTVGEQQAAIAALGQTIKDLTWRPHCPNCDVELKPRLDEEEKKCSNCNCSEKDEWDEWDGYECPQCKNFYCNKCYRNMYS